MLRAVLSLIPLLAASAAPAQGLARCDHPAANARFLKSPAAAAVRDFANGAITLIELDTYGEPTCCAAYLMVIHPVPGEPFPGCTLLTADDRLGYLRTDLAAAAARYDPAMGLIVDLPVATYTGGPGGGAPARVTLVVNQALGTVVAR